MATDEQIDGDHGGKRQQQAHQHSRHHQVAHGSVGCIAGVDQIRLQVTRNVALLLGQIHGLTCRAEAAQQGIDSQRHNAQHHDFAKGIEAAEVHQHHIDDVGATTFRQGALQEES